MKKILVADDDDGVLDAVSLVLEYNGFAVSKTLKGEMVITMLGEKPDLLLLDILMSGESGIEICKKVKQDCVTRHIPVILFSASRNMEFHAMQAGANDFIEKPFEIRNLLKKIQEHLY